MVDQPHDVFLLHRLSVMDENKLSSNAFIGETCVSLKSLINRPVQRFKKLLEPKSEVFGRTIHLISFPVYKISCLIISSTYDNICSIFRIMQLDRC